MWLTMIVVGVIEGALSFFPFPVSAHKVVLSPFSSITYPIPMKPVTAQSWGLLAVFYLLTIALFWVIAAAMVKRLHDRGRSGKWVAYFFGALAVFLALDALLSLLGPAFEVASMIFFAPLALLGALGSLEMFFAPSSESRWSPD
jgi:uncharacterized membrane protein YhaH (DUF805 family)